MSELSVGYCRVSTKKQQQVGLSLEAQESYIRSWAVDNDFGSPVKIFKVAESGGDSERKHLNKVFDYCLANGIFHILISDSDRWTRSREMDMEAQKFIKKHDLKVHILREQKIIGQFGSASEKLSHNVKVDVDQFVRETISEKSKAGIRKKLDRGEYPGTPSLGYKSIKKTVSSPHKIVQDEKAPKVKKLLEMFSTGKFSLQQTVELAKTIGLKPRVKNDFIKQTISGLIRSRFYYGEFEVKGKIYENKTAGFEPIITKKIWKKNQEILKNRQKNLKAKQGRGKAFRFNHLMVCGRCGKAIYGEKFNTAVKYDTKKNGLVKKKYDYPVRYHCTKSFYYISPEMSTDRYEACVPTEHVDKINLVVKKDIADYDEDLRKDRIWIKEGDPVEARICDMPTFWETEIDEILTDKLGVIKFKSAHWQKVKDILFEDDNKNFLDLEIRNLRKELTESETKLNSLYDDYKSEIIDVEFFKKQSSEIRNRQDEAKERLQEVEEERSLYDDRIGKSIEILDSLKNWDKILKKADAKKRDQLLKLLTIKISTAYEKPGKLNDPTMIKDLKITFSPEVEELYWLGIIEDDKKRKKGKLGNIESLNSSNFSNG